jgi:hypothetical protein
MQRSAVRWNTFSFEIILLECRCLPSTSEIAAVNMYTIYDREMETHDVNMSTVRSVSGFAVDVLKLGPLFTVNHCIFLEVVYKIKLFSELIIPLNDKLAFS